MVFTELQPSSALHPGPEPRLQWSSAARAILPAQLPAASRHLHWRGGGGRRASLDRQSRPTGTEAAHPASMDHDQRARRSKWLALSQSHQAAGVRRAKLQPHGEWVALSPAADVANFADTQLPRLWATEARWRYYQSLSDEEAQASRPGSASPLGAITAVKPVPHHLKLKARVKDKSDPKDKPKIAGRQHRARIHDASATLADGCAANRAGAAGNFPVSPMTVSTDGPRRCACRPLPPVSLT